MDKIRVIPPRPKHGLFFIKALTKLIMSYCQYDDAKKIFRMFRCEKPEKPLLVLSECLNESWLELPPQSDSKYDLMKVKLGKIDRIWIPYELGHHIDSEFIKISMKNGTRIMWQCPTCKKYISITFYNGDTPGRVLLYAIDTFINNNVFRRYIICKCQHKDEGFGRDEDASMLIFQAALDYHYLGVDNKFRLRNDYKNPYRLAGFHIG